MSVGKACMSKQRKDRRNKTNDYYKELENRDKATKPVKITGTEEIKTYHGAHSILALIRKG